MNAQARRIMLRARLYGILARRCEFDSHDKITRTNRALNDTTLGPLATLDAVSVIRASELDQLCGYVVRVLSRPKTSRSALVALLDVIGTLQPERIAAIYWAVPEARRKVMLNDVHVGYHVAKLLDGLPEAEQSLNELIAETLTTPESRELTALATLVQVQGSA